MQSSEAFQLLTSSLRFRSGWFASYALAGLFVYSNEKQFTADVADSRFMKGSTFIVLFVLLPMAIVYLARRRNAVASSSEAQDRGRFTAP